MPGWAVPFRSGSQRRDSNAKTWERIPQMGRWQVQRPWGRDQPDLLWGGQERRRSRRLNRWAGVCRWSQARSVQETGHWQG